jgi:hypothetical protein
MSAYEKALNESAKEGKKVELKKPTRGDKVFIQKGKYTVEITKDGIVKEREWIVE